MSGVHVDTYGLVNLIARSVAAEELLTRIHAAMIRCRWHEPTGMDEDKDSALNLEREVREWLGVKG